MSNLSSRLRDTADWIDHMQDGPGLRRMVSARLLEMAESAELLEADAKAMQCRLQRLPVVQLHLVPEETTRDIGSTA